MAAASAHLPFFAISPPRKSHPTISLVLIPQHTSSSAANNGEGPLISIQRKRARGACLAVAESLDVSSLSEDEESILYPNDAPSEEPKKEEAPYNWREEWYPLYLTKNVPEDAPLGLTVFHKQLVLYKDGHGVMRCYEDRCPHRLAKLSEGQLVDGRLECLYHGWQFEGDGHCVKIPQLPEGAKIPRSACAKAYEVKDSQGVVWVWMSEKTDPDESKLPWFEHYARPGFKDVSTIHELPYDHSILLENLMDPAHVPISHDRTDLQSKREDAQPLVFQLLERSDRGFAGYWWRSGNPAMKSLVRFQAPCVIQSNREAVDKKGVTRYASALFLCRPAGQGKTMVIVRFGGTKRSWLFDVFPEWFIHRNANTILEQDMGFLSSQNEVLIKEKVPTKELYLNLRSSDVWVLEYRRWLDKVGDGMPYYVGHSTISLPEEPAVVEHAPAGLVAAISASSPAKGGMGALHAPNFMNRYYRHVVHCKECSGAVKRFERWARSMLVVGLACAAAAIMASSGRWKEVAVAAAALCAVGYYACVGLRGFVTDNVLRKHRRL